MESDKYVVREPSLREDGLEVVSRRFGLFENLHTRLELYMSLA